MNKNSIRRIAYGIVSLLLLWCFTTLALVSKAETTKIVHLAQPGDLVVSFEFDTEYVDITFISPDGKRYTKDSPEVTYAGDTLWATFKIENASKGDWSVEFERGRNSEITYDVIDENLGLWIQYFNVDKVSDSKIDVSFMAEFGNEEDDSYRYEISAINEADTELSSIIAKGSTRAGKEETVTVDASGLISGEYVLSLNVTASSGSAEVFDMAQSDKISYVNPNNDFKMENFVANVDMGNASVLIDWTEYKKYADLIKSVVEADDVVIYNESLAANTNQVKIFFPTGTSKLSISLYAQDNGKWSEPAVKDIDFGNEYLILECEDFVAARELPIKYKTSKERVLNLSLNGDMGEYSLNGEDELYLDISNEENEIVGYFEADNNVFYSIEKTVSLDLIPPQIKLYDDVDGKRVASDKLTILGNVTGAAALKINETDVIIGEGGEFSFEYPLSSGENIINIKATDVNGLSALRTLTVYGKSGIMDNMTVAGIKEYIPLICALGLSLIIIVLCLIFMKKKDKSLPKTYNMAGIIIWDILLVLLDVAGIYAYLTRKNFSNSVRYLELAEKSIKEASEYLVINNVVLLGIAVVFVILVISLIITVLRGRKRKEYKLNKKALE